MTEWTKDQQAEHRKTWVAALRSGDYAQTKTRLHTKDGFCCLGVACDISGLGKWKKAHDCYEFGAEYGMLPPKVRDWLGLKGKLGSFGPDDGTKIYLADLNDSGKPFAEIADIIESEPEGLISK